MPLHRPRTYQPPRPTRLPRPWLLLWKNYRMGRERRPWGSHPPRGHFLRRRHRRIPLLRNNQVPRKLPPNPHDSTSFPTPVAKSLLLSSSPLPIPPRNPQPKRQSAPECRPSKHNKPVTTSSVLYQLPTPTTLRRLEGAGRISGRRISPHVILECRVQLPKPHDSKEHGSIPRPSTPTLPEPEKTAR